MKSTIVVLSSALIAACGGNVREPAGQPTDSGTTASSPRCPLRFGVPKVELGIEGTPLGLAVDGTHVYWATGSAVMRICIG